MHLKVRPTWFLMLECFCCIAILWYWDAELSLVLWYSLEFMFSSLPCYIDPFSNMIAFWHMLHSFFKGNGVLWWKSQEICRFSDYWYLADDGSCWPATIWSTRESSNSCSWTKKELLQKGWTAKSLYEL